VSAATTNGHFPRDAFYLNLSTLPDASSYVLKSALKSPYLLESPNGLFPGSSRLSNPFKKRPRNMSQSSGTDREMSNDNTPPAQANGIAPTSNGANGSSTEPPMSSKKRQSTDTIDYPRRRATIAVQQPFYIHSPIQQLTAFSVKYAGHESRDATAIARNADYVPS
jgi:hypothetical protein